MRRKYGGILVVAVLMMALVLTFHLRVLAVNSAAFLQTAYSGGTNVLDFVMSCRELSDTEMPEPECFTVLLDGQQVDLRAVERAEVLPVVFYCVVDISLLQTGDTTLFDQEKEVLNAICDAIDIDTGDRMVIATLGDELIPSAYLEDKGEIRTYIRGLERLDAVRAYREKLEDGGGHTNLYQGIADAITDLLASEEAPERKCLVVLSDGQDSNYFGQSNSTVKSRADSLIMESDIPVYTVTLVREAEMTDAWYLQEEYQPIMNSFSQESAGGRNYTPLTEQISYSHAGKNIVQDMKHAILVHLDISVFADRVQFAQLHALAPLEVRLRGENGKNYTDTLTVSKSLLEIDTEHGLSTERVLAIGVGVCALLLAGILIVLLRRRMKPARETEAMETEKLEQTAELERAYGLDKTNVSVRETEKNVVRASTARILSPPSEDTSELIITRPALGQPTGEDTTREEEANGRLIEEKAVWKTYSGTGADVSGQDERKIALQVVAIGHPEIHFELWLPEGREVTVGRDDSAEVQLNPGDRKLSGVHFYAFLENGTLRVRDAGSTNGTSVDGVPLSRGQQMMMESGQTLWAGSYRYRIRIPEKEANLRG